MTRRIYLTIFEIPHETGPVLMPNYGLTIGHWTETIRMTNEQGYRVLYDKPVELGDVDELVPFAERVRGFLDSPAEFTEQGLEALF